MTLAQRNLPYSTFNQATSRELHVRAASPLPLGVAIDPPLHHKAFATPDNISPWRPRCYYASQRTIHLQTQRSLSRKGGVDLTRSCLRVFPCVFGCLYMHVFQRQVDAKYFFGTASTAVLGALSICCRAPPVCCPVAKITWELCRKRCSRS